MSSRNRKSNFSLIPEPLARGIGLLVGPARTPALAVVVVGLFAGAWWWSWQKVGADVLASDSYWLAPEDIVVSNEVDWIRSDDIRREVFHNASLESRLSIMDPELTERIAAAFSLHPWVASVRRVSKRHPAGLTVELEYRRPVCMVEAPGRLIPVDVEGNRLPDGDFALNQAVRFPRLTDIETMPVGPPGTRWGDLRVADGAAIAAALGDRWAAFRLDRIVPLRRSDSDRRPDYVYELYTHGGSRVVWGRAPGAKSPGEPSVAEKLQFLDSWVKRHGTLEGTRGPQEIDVPYLLKRGRTAGRAAPDRR